MSGTAVVMIRSAARRALRPTTTRFRRTLVANNEQPFSPMETITGRRRHYSAGGGVNMEENIQQGLNSRPTKTVVPKEIFDLVKRKREEMEQASRHTFLTVEEVSNVFDRRNLLMRQLIEEKLKYERLKRVLVRVPIFIGIAICVKKYFSAGGEEEAKNHTTESD